LAVDVLTGALARLTSEPTRQGMSAAL
jgi:hypothetical protein